MSELSLDFSNVPGLSIPGVSSAETAIDPLQPIAANPAENPGLTESPESQQIGQVPAELLKAVIEKFPKAIETVSSQALREQRSRNRWQVAATIAGGIAAGAIIALSGNADQASDQTEARGQVIPVQTEEKASPAAERTETVSLSAAQLDEIAARAGISTYRLLESNGLEAGAKITEDALRYRDGGVIIETIHEREEVAIQYEEGLTLSHVGQGLAVVRGDEALRPHLLNQLTALNPDAVESFVKGQKIILPSDVTREEALKVMDKIDDGCEVTPKLGDEAELEVDTRELQASIGKLTEDCGRNPQTVSSQMLQRNPDLVQNGQISFEGRTEVTVPFGEKTVRGGN